MKADPEPVKDEQTHEGQITVVGRLKEFYRARFWPEVNVWPEESAMYAVLHNPGRATNVQSDGGMAAMAENLGEQIAVRTRALEVAAAIRAMPEDYRKVIEATYDVPRRALGVATPQM